MQIRHAASALVALGAVSACALGASMIVQDHQDDLRTSELRNSSWSVQASTDFGTTWTAPISSTGGHFPIRVDTAALRDRPAYQPLTLRTTIDSRDAARVDIDHGVLIEGNPDTAAEVRVRAVISRSGACAGPTFTGDAPRILGNTQPVPVDSPTHGSAFPLPSATRTTPGSAVTVCMELSMDADSTAPDSELTLAWPIDISRDSPVD